MSDCSLITLMNCGQNIRPMEVHRDKEELDICNNFSYQSKNCYKLSPLRNRLQTLQTQEKLRNKSKISVKINCKHGMRISFAGINYSHIFQSQGENRHFMFTLVKMLFVCCFWRKPCNYLGARYSLDFMKKLGIFGFISDIVVQYESEFMLFYFLKDIHAMMKLLQDEKTASKEL